MTAAAIVSAEPAVQARPFLKWVGGKTQLLPELLRRMPEKFGTYYEPFVGAGALFFALAPARAVLNDANARLVATFAGVRDHVEAVIGLLGDAASAHSEEFYYRRRDEEVDHLPPAEIAAWMIYMNKAGFNGLYRVSASGKFNVSWGKHEAFVPDVDNLRACAVALRGRRITHEDFRAFFTRVRPRRGDVVYFDPPYAPLSATSDFTSYTKEKFGPDDQRDLRDLALLLKGNGVHVILSNSAAPIIRDLYGKGFTVEEVYGRRSVNSDGAGRGAIKELLIT